MQLRLTAVDAVSGASADVLLHVSADTTIAEVERRLAVVHPPTRPGLYLGEARLDRSHTVQQAGLRQGALVSVGGPLPQRRVADPLAELRVVSGPDSGAIHQLAEGETLVGSAATVCLPDVGALQLRVQADPLGVAVTNLDQDHPVRRNGISLSGTAPVAAGELIEVGPHLIAFVLAEQGEPELLVPGGDGELVVTRPERRLPPAGATTLALPEPPGPAAPPRLDLRLVAVPVVVALPLAVLVSPLWLLVLVASPALAAGLLYWRRRTAQRLTEAAQAAYVDAREAASVEMQRLARTETARRREASPDAPALLRTATGPDARLWERRPDDADYLRLRFGTGALAPESWQVAGHVGGTTLLPDVPLTLGLRQLGSLTVAGAGAAGLARWLLAQVAVLHSPQDVTVWALLDDAAEPDWGWLRWLPHCAPRPGAGPLHLATTARTREARLAELTEMVAIRTALAEDVRHLPAPPADVVVLVDAALAARAEVRRLVEQGPAVGVLWLVLDPAGVLDAVTGAQLVIDDLGASLRGTPDAVEGRAEAVAAGWAEQVARALAPVRDGQPRAGGAALPQAVRLLDLLDLADVSPGSVTDRWQSGGGPLVAGATADGVLTVDLAQDGPHVVVAGAGSDEVLRAFVLGLALSTPPDVLSVVLLGPAAGAGWAGLEQLPHTVAALSTDPQADPAAVHRTLTALAAEARRRSGAPGPHPRLVVAVDELEKVRAELVPSAAAALDQLVDAGAELGVHLLIGTRRPSAVLNPMLRLAAGARLSLRLTEADESLEVLDSSAAATVPAGLPGRGFARIRQGPLVAFQAASVGSRPLQAASSEGLDQAVILTWGQLGEPSQDEGATDESADTDVTTASNAIAAAAAALHLGRASGPWLPELPATVPLDEVRARAENGGSAGPGPVPYALADLPAERAQRAVGWDLESDGHLLAVGDAGSGRTTLLATLAGSLATSVPASDAHLYVLDAAGGSLRALGALPHCGAVVLVDERERTSRLVTRLTVEVERRRQQLADRGFADLAAQRRGSADPLPYLVLLVDGWPDLEPAIQDQLRTVLVDGAAAGLRAAVTGDRRLLDDPLVEHVGDRLAMRLDDREDYRRLGLDPRLLARDVPPGRAFRGRDATPLQIGVLAGSLPAAIEQLAAELPAARGRKPFRVDVLPTQITVRAAGELGTSGLGAPLAVGGDELRFQAVHLPACGPGFTIAGPPGSGRSTALAVMARALLDAEYSLCLVAPRPSPLRALSDAPGVLASGTDAAGLARAIDRAAGPLVVVVDDAELIEDPALDQLLQELLREGRQRDRSVVLAGTTEVLAGQSSGFAYLARRSRSGLLLWPGPGDGDLWGVRLAEGDGPGPVGRGTLVRSGQSTAVQVPLPD